jgi:glucosamine--fructose-6-phosphate aminotransferase (isomerizing)
VIFASETDTEALAHLIAAALANGASSIEDAVRATLREVNDAYGIVVLDAQNPGQLVPACNGRSIVLGIGGGEMFVASDVAALVRYT